jgi:hypothetical protein
MAIGDIIGAARGSCISDSEVAEKARLSSMVKRETN